MYLTVVSWFRISFVMGGVARAGRTSSFMHLLLHPPQNGPWNLPRELLCIKPSFMGPKWHSPLNLMPFHRFQKTLEFQGPTPSHLPSSWICTHLKHYAWGCINHRCIKSTKALPQINWYLSQNNSSFRNAFYTKQAIVCRFWQSSESCLWTIVVALMQRLREIAFVLQAPSKSFRHCSLPRVMWGVLWEVKSMSGILSLQMEKSCFSSNM
jgi:hypothetical protein